MQERLLQAQRDQREGRLESARALYGEVLALEPEQAVALHYWGVLLAQAGQLSRALRWVDRSLRLEPTTVQFLSNAPQNFKIPPGGEKSVSLEKAEPAPIPVDCNIHPWMKSYVVVADHPFVGISNEDGVLEIKGLPVGKLTFRLWHENADGSIKEIKVGSKKEKLSKNNIELNIKAGENDLGKVEIAAGAFSLK